MTTGPIQSWGGNIADIGPLYPFTGSEMIMVIVLVVFWIGWHILQLRHEGEEIRETHGVPLELRHPPGE